MSGDAVVSIVCLLVICLTMASPSGMVKALDVEERSVGYSDQDVLMKEIESYLRNTRSDELDREQNEAFSDSQPTARKRNCRVGIFGNQCRMSDLDAALKRKDYLKSKWSPGKRSDLSSLLGLRGWQQPKKSCYFRLGGHCVTEAMDKAAKQHHFLKSADSPGKRRRRSIASGRINGDALRAFGRRS